MYTLNISFKNVLGKVILIAIFHRVDILADVLGLRNLAIAKKCLT